MSRHASHMEFNFPKKEGSGILKLIPNISPDSTDVIVKLLVYNPDQRMSAGQALKHAYFRDLREQDKSVMDGIPPGMGGGNQNTVSQLSGGVMRLTHRGADSMSQKRYSLLVNVSSISKFSDNISEGNYPDNKKKQIDKYNTTKNGQNIIG